MCSLPGQRLAYTDVPVQNRYVTFELLSKHMSARLRCSSQACYQTMQYASPVSCGIDLQTYVPTVQRATISSILWSIQVPKA